MRLMPGRFHVILSLVCDVRRALGRRPRAGAQVAHQGEPAAGSTSTRRRTRIRSRTPPRASGRASRAQELRVKHVALDTDQDATLTDLQAGKYRLRGCFSGIEEHPLTGVAFAPPPEELPRRLAQHDNPSVSLRPWTPAHFLTKEAGGFPSSPGGPPPRIGGSPARTQRPRTRAAVPPMILARLSRSRKEQYFSIHTRDWR